MSGLSLEWLVVRHAGLDPTVTPDLIRGLPTPALSRGDSGFRQNDEVVVTSDLIRGLPTTALSRGDSGFRQNDEVVVTPT